MASDAPQRAIVAHLLDRHPAMLGLGELAAALPDVASVEPAAGQLADDGVVVQLGDRVGLTRAAVRALQLAPA
jgi:hypothetical protein